MVFMSSEQTLCHVVNGNKILLKLATRGISKGRWNAPGGRIEPGETPEQCAIREVFEETGLKVKNLTFHGVMKFYNNGSKEPMIIGYLFSTRDLSGDLKSSDEGEVRWFNLDDLPWAQMWPDDPYWIKHMLSGKKFDFVCHFNEDNTKVTDFEVTWR